MAQRMGIPEDEVEPMDDSLLARIAQPVSIVFKPLGFGDWKPTAALAPSARRSPYIELSA